MGRKHRASVKINLSVARKEKAVFSVLETELEKRKITRRGLAKMVGVSHTTVIKKLRGDIALDLATAEKFREVLAIETPLEELFRMADGSILNLTPPSFPYLYPVLYAELKRRNLTFAKFVEAVGLSDTSISAKMLGIHKFSSAQMTAVKNFLKVDMSIEELFRGVD